MPKSLQKSSRIKPNFIKDKNNKIIEVFLDMKSYESMMNRIQKFEEIIKADKSKKQSVRSVAKKSK